MKTWIRASLALALTVAAGLAAADTPAEAKAMLADAHALVVSKGLDGAAADFNAGGKWKHPKAYVVLVNFDGGTLLAHADNPKLAGKSFLEARDASGKAFVQETIANVKSSGESLVDYRWANPTTKKIDNGHLMARRVPGKDAYVAVGYWE